MEGSSHDNEFLPPEPSGPEPDLGEKGQPQQPHQDTTQQLPQTEQTQPYAHQPPPQGWPPPQQGYGQPQGHGQPQGYGSGPPPGWHSQPPAGWQQPGWQGQQQQAWPGQQPWQPHAAWATGPKEPDNTPAVAGFSLSMTGGGLLILSGGLSSVVSLGLSIAGWVYSRKGKAMVESGKTQKHGGLAQAGFVIGIIATILSVVATLAWGGFIVALIVSEDFRRDLKNSNGNTFSMDLLIPLLRGLFSLLS